MQKTTLLAIATVFSSFNLLSAQAIVFDFESLPGGGFSSVVSTVEGLTLTATSTVSGAIVRTDNPPHQLPLGMGDRSLVGSLTERLVSNGFTPIRMGFSSLLNSLSVDVGDKGGDNDGTVRIRAYDALDQLIASDSLEYGFSELNLTLSIAAPGISYIIADSFGGPNNLNSVLWDNVTVTVPEPNVLALVAIFGVLASCRRT